MITDVSYAIRNNDFRFRFISQSRNFTSGFRRGKVKIFHSFIKLILCLNRQIFHNGRGKIIIPTRKGISQSYDCCRLGGKTSFLYRLSFHFYNTIYVKRDRIHRSTTNGYGVHIHHLIVKHFHYVYSVISYYKRNCFR